MYKVVFYDHQKNRVSPEELASALRSNALILNDIYFLNYNFFWLSRNQNNNGNNIYLYKLYTTPYNNEIYFDDKAGFFQFQDPDSYKRYHVIVKSFVDDSDEQFFAKYLLARILGINLLDDQSYAGKASAFAGSDFCYDFSILALPFYLRRAYMQGVYSAYREFEANDSRFCGALDLHRHLVLNTPYIGNVCYKYSDLTSNNFLIILIRFAVEKIKSKFPDLLVSDDEFLLKALRTIEECSRDYCKFNINNVIALNSRPIKNPFFTQYEKLRRLCLRILNEQKLDFNDFLDTEIDGVIYDMRWLWEEYVWLVLKEIFTSSAHKLSLKHGDNNSCSDSIYPLQNLTSPYWIPDYYTTGQNGHQFVLDAKYKSFSNNCAPSSEDTMQITAYMHVLNASHGVLIYPKPTALAQIQKFDGSITDQSQMYRSFQLTGLGGKIAKFAIQIPQTQSKEKTSFADFFEAMKLSEKCFKKMLLMWLFD